MKSIAPAECILVATLLGLLAFQWTRRGSVPAGALVAKHQLFDSPPADTSAGTKTGTTAAPAHPEASQIPQDFESVYGMHVSSEHLKGAWECALAMVSADLKSHGLGPGVSLPLDLAPEMGLTKDELAILNRHATAAVEEMQAYEKTTAKMEANREGEYWRIPAYPEKMAEIMAVFRQKGLAAIGERARPALDVMAASPYLNSGERPVSVSAVREADGSTGVQIGRSVTDNASYREISGAYDSDAGIFAISRYSHIMNFAAFERKK